MTPSHAVKNGKRYWYYISNNLIAGANRGRDGATGDGVRIAALEIERHVVTAIAMFLADAQRVLTELCPVDTPPAIASAAMRSARSFGEELKTDSGMPHYESIRNLIARVQVDDGAIYLKMNRSSLFEQLSIALDKSSPEANDPLELKVSAELRRIGKEKRLIVHSHAPERDALRVSGVG